MLRKSRLEVGTVSLNNEEKIRKYRQLLYLILETEKNSTEHLDDLEFRQYVVGLIEFVLEDEELK